MSSLSATEYHNNQRELKNLLSLTDAEMNDARESSHIPTKQDLISKVERQLNQCERLVRIIDNTTRHVSTAERTGIRQALKAKTNRIREMQNDLKWLKSEVQNMNNNNNTILGISDAEQRESLLDFSKNGQTVNNDALMSYARNIQKKDADILDSIAVTVDQTKAQAVETAQQLQMQSQQIERIDNNLAQIDNELDRAKRVMVSIMRRIATDKCIWCIVGLLFLALCGLIYLQMN